MSDYNTVDEQNKEVESKIDTGAPHFKSQYRKYRQSDYTLQDSIAEFIDNIITKCKNIKINITVKDDKILRITISDDYCNGFENINEVGYRNPFNMGHMRDGQNDDSEISQFGVGFKAGAISTGYKLTVYTQVNEKYHRVIMDFDKMCKEEDVNKSYNPLKYPICKQEYEDIHPFKEGSTIVLEEIHNEIYSKTTEEDLIKNLTLDLSNLFGNVVKKINVKITLNDNIIKPNISYFDEKQCSCFNSSFYIYNTIEDNYIIRINEDFYEKSEKNKNNLVKITNTADKDELKESIRDNTFKNSLSDDEKACIIGKSTFTSFHPNYYPEIIEDIPNDKIQLYNKYGRCFGNWTPKKTVNGANNFNYTQVTISSKDILKKLGLTFNKKINRNANNEISQLLEATIKKNTSTFSNDTSTPTYLKLYKKAINNNIISENDTIKKPKKKLDKNKEDKINEEDEEINKMQNEINMLKEKLNPQSKIVDSSQTIESKNSHNKSNIEKPEVTKVSSKITQIEKINTENSSSVREITLEEEDNKSETSLSLESYDTENDILETSNNDNFENLENTIIIEEESPPSEEKLPSEEETPSEEESSPSEEESQFEDVLSSQQSSTNKKILSTEEDSINKKISPSAKSIDKGPKTDTHIGYDSMMVIINVIKKDTIKFESHKEDFRSEYINLRKEFSQNCDYNAINKNEMYLIERLPFIEIINAIEWLYEQNYTSKNTCVVRGADINRLFKKIDNNTN